MGWRKSGQTRSLICIPIHSPGEELGNFQHFLPRNMFSALCKAAKGTTSSVFGAEISVLFGTLDCVELIMADGESRPRVVCCLESTANSA